MDLRLNRPFRMVVFDWDGTAVENRWEDAAPLRSLLERLLRLDVYVVVITGTSFGNVDRQLSATINGPHKQRLYICTNRGSEVFGFDARSNPVLLYRRVATPQENHLLTKAANRVREILEYRTGLPIRTVRNRLNRRKIDLIALPEWSDPPKSAFAELLRAVEQRLKGAGLTGGLHEAIELTDVAAREAGLKNARITSDVKHVEVGLTDKGDSVAWAMRAVAEREGIAAEDVLIAGDEFGPIAGFGGSDSRMMVDAARAATFVSVGVEPNGVPAEVIHLDGGPARFRDLLDEQILLHEVIAAKAKASEPVSIFEPTADPLWILVEEGFSPAREHEIESLFTVANGYSGTRGSLDEVSPLSRPASFIAGVYDAGPGAFHIPELVVVPNWTHLRIRVGEEEMEMARGNTLTHRRTLDLRRGILLRNWRYKDSAGRITSLSFLRFASLADRHLLVQLVALTPENYTERVGAECTIDGRVANSGGVRHLASSSPTPSLLVAKTLNSGIMLAMASSSGQEIHSTRPKPDFVIGEHVIAERWQWEAYMGTEYRLDRTVAVETTRDVPEPVEAAADRANSLSQQAVEALLAAHERAWAGRWDTADVEIEGSVEDHLSLRFALYHLIAAANPDDGRVSVGARGLTGEAYKGHVFWDTDIYMLPFYTFTHPPSARALLMYRFHNLPAARERAREMGYRGALYPWESADDGRDVTPPLVLTPAGEVIPIYSRLQEHHISADIPYAVWHYWQATGDDDFFLEAGAEILVETARFWASRVASDEHGRYHIRSVIGPDEYHENVDDSAYTNLMAQWALDKGAEAREILGERWPERWLVLSSELLLQDDEIENWREIARNMVSGYDPETGLFEQFAGYFALEYLDVAAYEPRTAPMDVVLGRERTKETQVIKQADVVLLTYLLWDRFSPPVHEANFRFYEPRSGHGSSLSPAIHALVAARLGDLAMAEKYFRQAAEIDLANNMGNAAEGLHLGAMGGLWQAVVFGFAGMRLRDYGLAFDPHVPTAWGALRFPVQWRGRLLRVAITALPLSIEVALERGQSMVVAMVEGDGRRIEKGTKLRTQLSGQAWSAWEEV